VGFEGFTDVSQMLRGGVYMLVHRGVVVYVGKSKVMLGRIYTHRAAWGRKARKPITGNIPARGILFDQILIQPCASDRIDALEVSLIAQHKPRYNTQLKSALPPELASLISRLTPVAQSPRILIDRRGF
jgi:excinuclease UvrABC nuclease subunit